jgi:hypothetical protein
MIMIIVESHNIVNVEEVTINTNTEYSSKNNKVINSTNINLDRILLRLILIVPPLYLNRVLLLVLLLPEATYRLPVLPVIATIIATMIMIKIEQK